MEKDFVALRRDQGNDRISPQDFHSMLVLARLLSVTEGESTLTSAVWARVKEMEAERRGRVAHLPQRRQHNNGLANGNGH